MKNDTDGATNGAPKKLSIDFISYDKEKEGLRVKQHNELQIPDAEEIKKNGCVTILLIPNLLKKKNASKDEETKGIDD